MDMRINLYGLLVKAMNNSLMYRIDIHRLPGHPLVGNSQETILVIPMAYQPANLKVFRNKIIMLIIKKKEEKKTKLPHLSIEGYHTKIHKQKLVALHLMSTALMTQQ